MERKLTIRLILQNLAASALKGVKGHLEWVRAKSEEASSALSEASSATQALGDSLTSLATQALGLYSIQKIFDATVASGVRLNAQFESLEGGIAALLSAASSDFNALGERLEVGEKMRLAKEEAREALEALKVANRQTTATLSELSEGFQSALAPAKALGLSTGEVVKFTKDMAIAAGALGMPLRELSQEIRGVLSGDTSKNSRINQILGINEATIKAHASAGTLAQFLSDSLRDYAAFGEEAALSFSGALSNVQDDLGALIADSTTPLFEKSKQTLLDFGALLSEHEAELRAFGTEASLALSVSFSQALDSLSAITHAFRALSETLTPTANGFDTLRLIVGGFAMGISTLAGIIEGAVYGLSILGSEAEIALVKLKALLGLESESDSTRIARAEENIREKIRRNEAILSRLNEQSKALFEVEVPLSQPKAIPTPERLIAKPMVDTQAIETRAKAQEALERYLEESHQRGLESRYERELSAERRKMEALLKEHSLSLKEREQLEESYQGRIAQIRALALQSEEKTRREALKHYYQATSQKAKAHELEIATWRESSHAKALSESQRREVILGKEREFERGEQIARLKQWERYYEALGEKARAQGLRKEQEYLGLQAEGFSPKDSAEMSFGAEARRSNYDALHASMGVDGGIAQEWAQRLGEVEQFQALELERINAFYEAKEASAEAHAQKMQEIEAMRFQANLATANAGFGALGSLAKSFYEASGRDNKAALRVYQIASVAQAIISTYTAASKALATGGPIAGPVMAGVAIAQGMAHVAMIKAQKFHSGGVVPGSGEVPAVLLGGEGVLSKKGMENLGALNSSRPLGGEETSITVVNALGTEALDQWASSRHGRRVIKNIINGD